MRYLREAVEKHRTLIYEAERYIWAHPETGYKEEKTSAYLAEQFEALGYELVKAEGITGFYTVFDTGREGPELLIFGELDSIICPNHPESDPKTGAIHSCGHNAQCAALLGIAAALKDPTVIKDLCGRIRLCAVPAEELLEIEYRSTLRKAGKIKYFGGKTEFLRCGYLDGADIAFMVHTANKTYINPGNVGCIAKSVIYKGKAAHAGGAPWSGCNALYAANCGINAVNAIRETFKETDIIRFHPIMTHGGSMVNAIPETARIETYVRGRTFEGIASANQRVNRALVGGALSLGANVEIIDIPGYAPLNNDPNMCLLCQEALDLAIPELPYEVSDRFGSGSTDMGDLSCIMPVIHPHIDGAIGTSHGEDYYINDPEIACVKSAIWQLAMATLLLKDNAARAKTIMKDFKPLFPSKEEYLAYIDSLNSAGDRIVYREDGTAEVCLR